MCWQANRKWVVQKGQRLQARYDAESAMLQTLHGWREEPPINPPGEIVVTPVALPWGRPVEVAHFTWGLLRKICIPGSKEGGFPSLERLCAPRPDSIFDNALVLAPEVSELVVCGDTRVIGAVRVGPRGVKSAIMDGRPYSGDSLIFGEIIASAEDQRPAINREFPASLFRFWGDLLFQADLPRFNSGNFRDTLHLGDTLGSGKIPVFEVDPDYLENQRGQISGPAILVCRSALRLTQKLTLDHIQLISLGPLFLGDSLQCRQSIFFSPEALFLNHLWGATGQFFSQKGITISASRLAFPSIAVVCAREDGTFLNLSENSLFEGTLAVFNTGQASTGLTISAGSRLRGAACSDGEINLAGEVAGSVVCQKLHFYRSPNHYFNRLLDARINRREYALPILAGGLFDSGDSPWQVVDHRWP